MSMDNGNRGITGFIKEKLLAREDIRYLIAGGFTTLLDIGVFALLNEALRVNMDLSHVTSSGIAIIFAYVTNKFLVFKRRCGTRRELLSEIIKFTGARVIMMGVQDGLLHLLVDKFFINETVSKAASTVIVIVVNYIVSKALVFRRKTVDNGE